MKLKIEHDYLPVSMWPARARPWLTLALCDDGGDGGGDSGGDSGDSGDSSSSSDGDSGGTGGGGDDSGAGGDGDGSSEGDSGMSGQTSSDADSQGGPSDTGGSTSSYDESTGTFGDNIGSSLDGGAVGNNSSNYDGGPPAGSTGPDVGDFSNWTGGNTYSSGVENAGGGKGTNNGDFSNMSTQAQQEADYSYTHDNSEPTNVADSTTSYSLDVGFSKGPEAGAVSTVGALGSFFGPGVGAITNTVATGYNAISGFFNGSTVTETTTYAQVGESKGNEGSFFGSSSTNNSGLSGPSSSDNSGGSNGGDFFGGSSPASSGSGKSATAGNYQAPATQTTAPTTGAAVQAEQSSSFDFGGLIVAILLAVAGA